LEGLQLGLFKDSVGQNYSVTYGAFNQDAWSLNADGWGARLKFLKPLGTRTIFSSSAGLGAYRLSSSRWGQTGAPGGGLALDGEGTGSFVEAGLELLTSKRRRFSLFFGLFYRFLTMQSLKVSGVSGGYSYSYAPLYNYDGSPATLDMGGPVFLMGLSAYMGGKKGGRIRGGVQ
jgi:hypothetical protein